MADVKDIDELSGNEAPLPLPNKKSSAIPGFAALNGSGKRNLIIFTLVVVGVLYFIFSGAKAPEKVPLEAGTTGDQFADASIAVSSGTLGTGISEQDVLEQARQAESNFADFGVQQDMSGVENVQYGNWLATSEPEKASPIKPAFGGRISNDRNFDKPGFVDVKGVSDRLKAQLKPQSVYTASSLPVVNRQSATAGSQTNQTLAAQQVAAVQSAEASNSQPKAGLIPGDAVVCKMAKAINTDVSSETYCDIQTGPLENGKITLKVTRKDDYIYLQGTNLILNRNFVPLQGAVAVDISDIAATGIRDDVDYHRFSRFSAIMLAGAGGAVYNLVGQPRTRTESSAVLSTTETIKASDREIVLAALAMPIQLAQENLIKHYNTPPTVFLEKDRLIHIYFTEPVVAPWLPDLTNKRQRDFKVRTY